MVVIQEVIVKERVFLFVLFAALLCFAYTSKTEAAGLSWVGCGITKKAFMLELAEKYKEKTGIKIVIRGGGATKGIRDVADGFSDIGGSCRHKIDNPAEKTAILHQVAWDALVVITHKKNPIDDITVSQVRDILTGKINNWKDPGGTDSPISLYVRKGKISGVGLITREILFNNPVQEYSRHAKVKKSSGPVERAISGDRNGFGITGISSAVKNSKLKILKVGGITPSKANIASGRYPFYRPLFLTTAEKPSANVRGFIKFALSPEGQAIISNQGTVNLREGKLLKIK